MLPRTLLFCLTVTPAWADIEARFIESAPKDRFEFTNTGTCALGAATLTVDLSGSAAGLIFDTSGTGAGVQVFQPFELTLGAEQVIGTPGVADGDQNLTLSLRDLAPGQSVAFTIDVDDTIGQREITVSGSEISGASVSAQFAGQSVTASFDTSAMATLPWTGCSS